MNQNLSNLPPWHPARVAFDEMSRPAYVKARLTQAIQERLDAFARTRGYDNIMSACTYVTSAVPKFAAEAAYCVSARDSTWATSYQIMAAVESGQRPIPTVAEVLAELPALAW